MIAAEPAGWLTGMTGLGPVAWPPAPIRTGRLVLRESEARDRAAFVELLASPEVHTYLGGPRQRDELVRELPEAPARWPGSLVVDLDGAMIGRILLRRATEHRRPTAVGKVDLGYLFLPRAWGFGYAAEACAAALDWFDGVLPGEPVVLTTQTANVSSMPSRRSWGSPRWSGSGPGTPSSGWACGPRSRGLGELGQRRAVDRHARLPTPPATATRRNHFRRFRTEVWLERMKAIDTSPCLL
ncbi:GNAT family N-acetyltransferase [Micromonospora sp. AP08]|uniref:GNAT family N-acetyltransferase n=1 Tax=Micromonospora sp. AP08 TaxID=2604467 RepID=UPI001CA327A1|nr:GNAT family N-acetyltransferase [Micromonospora sp. AP08]